MDKTKIIDSFKESLEEARQEMLAGNDKGSGLGSGHAWLAEIGGVPCDVRLVWFVDMNEIRDGRNLVVAECNVNIWPQDGIGPREDEDHGYVRLERLFEYVEGGVLGDIDPWHVFQSAWAEAQEKLKEAPGYLALHEAHQLRESLPSAKPKPKASL